MTFFGVAQSTIEVHGTTFGLSFREGFINHYSVAKELCSSRDVYAERHLIFTAIRPEISKKESGT